MANDDTGETPERGADETDEISGRGNEFGYEERETGPAEGSGHEDDRSEVGNDPPWTDEPVGPPPEGEAIGPDRNAGRERRGGVAADRRLTRVASGVAALLGAWVAVSAVVYGTGDAALWNNVLVGAAVFLGAGYNYYRRLTDHPSSPGVAGLVALLGIWLILAAAVLGLAGGAAWSTAISGLLVAVLSGYALYEARESPTSVAGEAGTR